jgi:hypothetical protein
VYVSTTSHLNRRRHRATAAATLLVAVLSCFVLSASAHAATYGYAPCDGFGNSVLYDNAATAGFRSYNSAYGDHFGGCHYGALRLDMVGLGVRVPAYAAMGWHFDAPSNVRVAAFVGAWTGYARPLDSAGGGILHIQGDGFDLGQYAAGAWTAPIPFSLGGLSDANLDLSIGCQASSSCEISSGMGWLQVDHPFVALNDTLAPSAGGTFGSAVSDAKWVGTKNFNYAATDRGGGLRTLSTYVDGVRQTSAQVDGNGGLCSAATTNGYGLVYGSPVPCKLSVSSSTETDSTTLTTDGMHTISYRITDVAGNEVTLYSGTKLVANHPPVNVALPAPTAASTTYSAPIVGTGLAMADTGSWTGPNLALSSSWVRCDNSGDDCSQIPGATTLAYTPTADDLGHRLRFAVTATNPADSVTVYSAPSGIVAAPQSATDIVDKPADGTNGNDGTNGSNGASGAAGANSSAGSGASASLVSVPSLTTTTTTNALHTFMGRVAGEPAGVACPGDKATLRFEHVKASQTKLGNGKQSTAQVVLTCTNTGKAVGGAKLEIATKTGVHATVASDVTTDGAGHAVLRLAKGASRAITVGYRMYADDPLARATATLKVLVNSKVSLKASRHRLHNGQAVLLRGKLAGGEVPKRGVTLAVQWKDGKRWRPFAQIKTTRKGTFTYAYRFTRTSRKLTYQLRVQVAKGQVDYPYVATASKRVKVIVAP